MPPTPCVSPHAAGDVGQADGEGWARCRHGASLPGGQCKGHGQRVQPQAGWPWTPPLPVGRASSVSGPRLSLQALHGAAAAQLPPALCVLHGDGGAPLHVRLRVLPGQRLGRLRGWHARRRQLRAWAPLRHWQCPQEEAAPAAAGPGEPRREGGRVLRWPTAGHCAGLCPLGCT